MNLRDIVEVRQVGLQRANDLLEAGYHLLAIDQTTQGVEREQKEGEAIGASFFVAKRLEYVIGRTAEQRPIIDLLRQWNDERRLKNEQWRADAERRAATTEAEITT